MAARCRTDEIGDGLPATQGAFGSVDDLALTPDGSVLVADYAKGRVRRIDSSGILSTLAGGEDEASWEASDGPAVKGPSGLAISREGIVYISDEDTNAIYRLNSDGSLTMVLDETLGLAPAGSGGCRTRAFRPRET